MSKRAAGTELNQSNWDEEEEVEESVFQPASIEELQKRVIRTAKRRVTNNAAGEKKSAFAGFSGFGQKSGGNLTTDSVKSTFSFLASSSNPPTTNGMDPPKPTAPPEPSSSSSTNSKPKEEDEDKEYLSKVRTLNQSLLDWVKMHVSKNPYCILSPVFDDYKKHIDSLVKEKEANKTGNKCTSEKTESKPFSSPLFTTSSSGNEKKDDDKKVFSLGSTPTLPTSGFSFGSAKPFSFGSTTPTAQDSKKDDSSSAGDGKSPMFKFGDMKPASGFSFGGAKPFSFGNVSGPASEKKEEGEEEETEEPPKNDFKQVTEEDATYSARVKVYFKKDGNLSDRGVGTLYIKPAPNDKHQLLVRADTNLGNILLNTLLSESIPVSKATKSVTLMCVPTPDSKPPPIPVFLKVKTDQDADKLFEQLEKCKKK